MHKSVTPDVDEATVLHGCFQVIFYLSLLRARFGREHDCSVHLWPNKLREEVFRLGHGDKKATAELP